MSSELQTNTGLNLFSIRQFRHLLWQSKQFSDSISQQNNSSIKQIVIELHNLSTDIDTFLKSNLINKQFKMKFQESEAQTTLKRLEQHSRQVQRSRYQQKTYSDIKHNTPVKSKRRVYETSTPLDKLNDQDEQYNRDNNEQVVVSGEQLQKQNKKLLNKLIEIEIKYDQLLKQKDYCIELLNRSTVKESDIEIQIKFLRNQNKQLSNNIKQLEEQNRNLIQNDEQKSILLKDIDEFFTNNDSKPGSKNFVVSSRGKVDIEKQRLIAEVVEYQHQVTRLNKQLNVLNQIQGNNEDEITNLINAHEQVLVKMNKYQIQNNHLKLKNQQLINIEHSKKLNEIVHKQNKHLLQVNYQLGNRIYGYQKQIEKLIIRVVELQQTQYKNNGIQTETHQGMSTNPSASKGICLEQHQSLTKTKNINDMRNLSSQKTINNLNLKLKNQTEINTELQNKIQELLDQLYICEKSIFEKEKEIANMTLSFNRTETIQNIPTTNVIESRNTEKDKQNSYQVGNQELSTQKDEILTLQEFVFKFEPSLMDTLFVMLRITQIAVVMLQEGYAKTIIPTQLLLQLDDPNKPQNIIVQLKSSQDQSDIKTSELFVSPDILEGYGFSEADVVWNIGMIFYYLICKEPYFKSVREIKELDEIQFKESLIPEVEELVAGTLKKDAEKRITLDELLEGISQQINKIFSEY